MTRGEECAELLEVTLGKVELLQQVIDNDKLMQSSLESQVGLLQKEVALRIADNDIYQGEVKRYKKRATGTIILCGIITGFTMFLAIK
jgi:hypothetical protein